MILTRRYVKSVEENTAKTVNRPTSNATSSDRQSLTDGRFVCGRSLYGGGVECSPARSFLISIMSMLKILAKKLAHFHKENPKES